jgi:hypothetical protein
VQIIKATLDHCNARNRLLAPFDFDAGDDKGGSFRVCDTGTGDPEGFLQGVSGDAETLV